MPRTEPVGPEGLLAHESVRDRIAARPIHRIEVFIIVRISSS
jgi:hypothetical protein